MSNSIIEQMRAIADEFREKGKVPAAPFYSTMDRMLEGPAQTEHAKIISDPPITMETGATPQPPAPSSSGSAPYWHPFQTKDETGEDGMPKISIHTNSHLYKNFSKEEQTITATDLGTPFSVAEGDFVWLSIGVTSQEDVSPDAASITIGSDFPGIIILTTDETGTFQTDYNQILAEVVAVDDARSGMIVGTGENAVKIIERLKSNLLCSIWIVNGVCCLVPEEIEL